LLLSSFSHAIRSASSLTAATQHRLALTSTFYGL